MSKGIWVVYNKETTVLVRYTSKNGNETSQYYGIGAAKAAVTRMQKKFEKEKGVLAASYGPLFDYGIADRDHYQKNIAKTVTRKNLMTGLEYQEDINTPMCCSPATERFWTM
jgi:hypothetical protein